MSLNVNENDEQEQLFNKGISLFDYLRIVKKEKERVTLNNKQSSLALKRTLSNSISDLVLNIRENEFFISFKENAAKYSFPFLRNKNDIEVMQEFIRMFALNDDNFSRLEEVIQRVNHGYVENEHSRGEPKDKLKDSYNKFKLVEETIDFVNELNTNNVILKALQEDARTIYDLVRDECNKSMMTLEIANDYFDRELRIKGVINNYHDGRFEIAVEDFPLAVITYKHHDKGSENKKDELKVLIDGKENNLKEGYEEEYLQYFRKFFFSKKEFDPGVRNPLSKSISKKKPLMTKDVEKVEFELIRKPGHEYKLTYKASIRNKGFLRTLRNQSGNDPENNSLSEELPDDILSYDFIELIDKYWKDKFNSDFRDFEKTYIELQAVKNLEDFYDIHYPLIRWVRSLRENGFDITFPSFSNKTSIKKATNPLLINKMYNKAIVCNNYTMGNNKLIVITGDYKSGKTSYAKGLAIMQYLAQTGLPVIAESAVMEIKDNVFYYPKNSDPEKSIKLNKMILEKATKHSLVVLDEPGFGFSGEASSELEKSLIEAYEKIGCNALIVSSNQATGEYAANKGLVTLKTTSKNGKPSYKLIKGVGNASFANEWIMKIVNSKLH